MSHHVLIYGAYAKKNTIVVSPFKKYTLPMYGDSNKGESFIGIKYGKIDKLYKNYTSNEHNLLLLCSEPSLEIKKLFSRIYPDLEGDCHALIQNVYTSHYASGVIAYGFWIYPKNEEVLDLLNEESFFLSKQDMGVIPVSHIMEKSTPSAYFYGKVITVLKPLEEPADDCKKLAKKLSKLYEPVAISDYCSSTTSLAKKIKTNEFFLHKYPEIAVISTMCYCCT
jgi:hypothetical protein